MLTLMPYFRRDGLRKRRGFNSFINGFVNKRFFIDAFPEGETFKTDIKETNESYIVQAELPGIAKEDIKVNLEEGILNIKAERRSEEKEEKDNYIRKEMKYGSFERSFRVENIKADDIKAKYNDGILEITLPKELEVKDKAKEIEVA